MKSLKTTKHRLIYKEKLCYMNTSTQFVIILKKLDCCLLIQFNFNWRQMYAWCVVMQNAAVW